jgi:hypothetical protein
MLEMTHLLLIQMVICMSGVELHGAALVRLLDLKALLELLELQVRPLQLLVQQVQLVIQDLLEQQELLVLTQLCQDLQDHKVKLGPLVLQVLTPL